MRCRDEVGVDTGGDIDAMNGLLVMAITDVATKLGMRKIVKQRDISTSMNKPWFDDDCRIARSFLKTSFRVYRDAGFDSCMLHKKRRPKKYR